MKIKDYLIDELKRLNRMNELLEKQINQGSVKDNESERMVSNVKAMCEIANTIYVYRCY